MLATVQHGDSGQSAPTHVAESICLVYWTTRVMMRSSIE